MALLTDIDPTASLQRGLMLGQQIKNARLQSQQQEEANKQKEEYRTDLQNALNNPTPQSMASLIIKYPQQQKAFSKGFEMLSKEQQDAEISTTLQVYSALNSGNTQAAKDILDKNIEGIKNSKGNSANLEKIRESIDVNPKGVAGFTLLMVSSLMGKDQFSKVAKSLGEQRLAEEMQPVTKEKAEAEVNKIISETGLKKAQTKKIIQENQTKPFETQIKLLEMADKQENTKLRMMEAQLRKTDNVLKKQELQLKVDTQKQKLDDIKEQSVQKKQERAAEAGNSVATFDRILSTLDKVKKHPGLNKATGMTSLISIIPGTEARDFEALVDTLESQAFTAEIEKMKGLGALSEAEGKKLSQAVGNFDRGQTAESFIKNIDTAVKIFETGKTRAAKKYNITLPEVQQEEEQTLEQSDIITTEQAQQMGITFN